MTFTTRPWWRWIIPLSIGMLLFANHFVRDSVGSLEKQLEDGFVTPSQYATINSLYFIPNMITPFLAGAIIEGQSDVSNPYLISLIVATIGHFFFALGVSKKNIAFMYTGRAIGGSMYEIIDALLPIVYLNKFFDSEFSIVIAIVNILLRTGSVVNFLLCPIMYWYFGVPSAYWLSAFISLFSILFMLLSMATEKQWIAHEIAINNSVVDDIKKESDEPINTLNSDFHSMNSDFMESLDSDDVLSPPSIWQKLAVYMPFNKLPLSFYYYALSGSLLYGSMVPFWFIGSKYLQNTFGMNVALGDGLLILPEGMIVVVSLPVALLLAKYSLSVEWTLVVLGLSELLLGISYCALVLSPYFIFPDTAHPSSRLLSLDAASSSSPSLFSASVIVPSIIMLFLGLGYALSNTIYWSLIRQVSSEQTLSFASGLTSCAVNILPAVVPPFLSFTLGDSNQMGMLLALALMAAIATLCAIACAVLRKQSITWLWTTCYWYSNDSTSTSVIGTSLAAGPSAVSSSYLHHKEYELVALEEEDKDV